MAKPKLRNLPDLSARAVKSATIAVKVTPKAAADRIVVEAEAIRIYVTAAPENGKANDSVRSLLAAAMKVAPSSLTLIRGHTSRDKVFAYQP